MTPENKSPRATLLLIDDDPVFRRLLTAMFVQDGFQVYSSNDVESGLNLLTERSFEVAVVDYLLPGLNGIDFFERSRRLAPQMTRILLTAHTTEEVLLEAINRGEVYRYMTKPVHLGLLRSTIDQALALHELTVGRDNMAFEMARRTQELEDKNKDLRSYYNLLGELKNQQDQILATLPEPFLLLNSSRRILKVNQTAIDLIGSTRGELLGKSADDFFLDPAELTERLFDIGKSGNVVFETTWRRKNGTEVQVKVALNLLRGDTAENNQAALVVQDITSVKQLEKLFRERSQELEQKVEDQILQIVRQQKALAHNEKLAALGTLVAGAAHEINSCDSFIKTNVEVLQHYWIGLEPILREWLKINEERKIGRQYVGEVIDDVQGLLEDLKAGTDQLGRIVEGLLAFSRKNVRKKEPFALENALSSALTVTGPRLSKLFKVRVKDCQKGRKVIGNFGQIVQVLVDLILNACDAGEEHAPLSPKPIVFFLRPGVDNRQIILSVSDRAGGMNADTTAHVFDPFFTTKAGRGTGLGLSICYGIINEHGGEIWVRSREGVGSAFSFSLPAA